MNICLYVFIYCLCVRMCVCSYFCMYVYIYIYMFVCIYILVVCTYVCVYVHTFICMYIYLCMYLYIGCVYICMCVCMMSYELFNPQHSIFPSFPVQLTNHPSHCLARAVQCSTRVDHCCLLFRGRQYRGTLLVFISFKVVFVSPFSLIVR